MAACTHLLSRKPLRQRPKETTRFDRSSFNPERRQSCRPASAVSLLPLGEQHRDAYGATAHQHVTGLTGRSGRQSGRQARTGGGRAECSTSRSAARRVKLWHSRAACRCRTWATGQGGAGGSQALLCALLHSLVACRIAVPACRAPPSLLVCWDGGTARGPRGVCAAHETVASLSLSGSLLHNCQRVDGPGRCSELAAGQTEMGVRGTTWPTATGGSIPLHRRAVRTAQPVDPPRFIFLPSFLVRVLCSHEDFFPACAGQPNDILAHSDFTAK